jgi:hypothetical protein
MPNAFEILFAESTTAGGIADDSRVEVTVDGDGDAEVDVALAAVVGVPA